MEQKNFNWLLFQLAQRQISLNLLEVGFCRRDKLLDWYCVNSNGQVHRNKVSAPSNLVKFLLSYFLSKRSPVLEEYKPDKQICYLYHKAGRKIITAKEAAEMLNNQLHGLDIISLHMALPGFEDKCIYTAYCYNRENELSIEINTKKFGKNNGTCIKDMIIADKIVNFIVGLCEIMGRFSKTLASMNLDLIVGTNLQVYLIKVEDLCFLSDSLNGSKEFQKVTNFKLSEDSSEDISDDELQHNLIIPEKDQRKKEGNHFKIPLSKPVVNNSSVFLEMIAKTIQRTRKNQFYTEFIQKKVNSPENLIFNKRTSYIFSSRDTNRDLNIESRLDTLSDLLSYLEKTRPKNWIRDSMQSYNKIATLKPPSQRKNSIDRTEKKIKQDLSNSSINKFLRPTKISHSRSASDSKLPPIKSKLC